MKFEKGLWYTFSIIGITNIPVKGAHYILIHESGRKMLLNTEYYVNYNLAIGQSIQCKVDKVNCTGQVFLEPKHPYYEEGLLYSFDLMGSKLNEDNTLSLKVLDFYKNEIQVLCRNNEEQISKTLILKVERIKKGIPILSYLKTETFEYLDLPDQLLLNISSIINFNSEDYYSLTEEGKVVSRLKVKYYNHYGFKVGSFITCVKRGYDSNGLILVEPENPWYKIGECYFFKVISFEEYIDLSGEKVRIGIVLDINANKSTVRIEKIFDQKQITNKQEIKCKVIAFRKGRPRLEVVL